MTNRVESEVHAAAIQNHLPREKSRIFFLHLWENDDAQKLARCLKAALDRLPAQRHAKS